MPLDISAHTPKESRSREITVPLEAYDGDVSVVLSYDPAAYNASIEQLMLEGFEIRPATTCQEVLLTFVVAWDLTRGGELIPITEEGLLDLRLFEVQVPLVNAIMADMGELGKSQRKSSPKSLSTARKRPPKSQVTAPSGANR